MMPSPEQETKALAIPRLVQFLGYAGLIPFVGFAGAQWLYLTADVDWLEAHLAYAACILSFLGGIHWAFAMLLRLEYKQEAYRFIWSVTPSLIAWSSFLLHPLEANIILLLGFALQLWQDLQMRSHAQIPTWYFTLRWQLTVIASLSLLSNLILHGFS